MGLWARIVAELNGETRSPRRRRRLTGWRPEPELEMPLCVCVPADPIENDILVDVYSVNLTPRTVSVKGPSPYTTVVAETGETIIHGSAVLAPGEAAWVADVDGWQWEGAVPVVIDYLPEGEDEPIIASYIASRYLGRESEQLVIPLNGKTGTITDPYTLWRGGGRVKTGHITLRTPFNSVDSVQQLCAMDHGVCDERVTVLDMPDGRTRVVESTNYALSDNREEYPFVTPMVIDLVEKRFVLDMTGYRANFVFRWKRGLLSLREETQSLRLTIDVAGKGFRDDSAPNPAWQPIADFPAWVAARLPSLREPPRFTTSAEFLAPRPPRREPPLSWPPPFWYWVPWLIVIGVITWRALGLPPRD